jgi:hypothetical protein
VIDLAALALALPGVTRGIACAGTALESRTFGVGKRAFLFVSAKEARLKLDASAADATAAGYPVGASGWVKLPLAQLPPIAVLRRWIAESRALVAGDDAPAAAATPPAKKARPKSGATGERRTRSAAPAKRRR